MIKPIPSQAFGAHFNKNEGRVENFTKTQVYNKKWLGLNDLYDAGRFMNCAFNGKHLSLGCNSLFKLAYILSLDNCNYVNGVSNQSDDIYRNCVHYKLKLSFL